MSETEVKPSAFDGIRRAMSHKGYRRYWIGMSISTMGFWGYRVALLWLVWELTHSEFWLGLIVFVEMIPMTIVGPIAGAITDRQGALRMARISQCGWAFAIGLLALFTALGWATKEGLIFLAIVQGVASGFSNPSHMALVAKLVPTRDLAPAIALQSGTVQTGRFIGPALAGPVIVFAGPETVFAIVTLGFLIFVLLLLTIETLEVEEPHEGTLSLMGEFIEGVTYMMNHFAIRTIFVFTFLMAILLRPLAELMSAFADKVFDRGAEGLALLMAAYGVGALISAIWIAIRADTKGLTRVFSINLLIGGIALLAFAFTETFWLAMGLVVIIGMSSNNVNMAAQTLTQTMVDGHMRARVMGLLGITFRAIPALGALFLGLGQSAFGLAAPTAVAALLCIGVWIYFARLAAATDLAKSAERPFKG